MKKKMLLALMCLSMSGCETVGKDLKHIKSSTVGIHRQVVLFSANGDTIKTWDGTFKVEVDSGTISWINNDGHETKIDGTWIIEETR